MNVLLQVICAHHHHRRRHQLVGKGIDCRNLRLEMKERKEALERQLMHMEASFKVGRYVYMYVWIVGWV